MGIIKTGANPGAIDTAIVSVCNTLHVQEFLTVRAIGVHHRKHWDVVVRCCPQHTASIGEAQRFLRVGRNGHVNA